LIFELIEDIAKLALIVAGLYFALGAYVRRTRPAWSGPLERRRHGHVPGTLTGFFQAVTFTGSSRVLFPLASVATISGDERGT
jgi:hypothetical protein